MHSPERHGKKISIRPINSLDIDSVYTLYSNNKVCEFYDLVPFSEQSQAAEQINTWLRNFENGKQIRYAICENNRLVGTCGLYSIYRHQNRACLGYDLVPDKWNLGYMSEALSLFLDICFSDWDFHRIQALVLPENNSSKKLLSKLGFKNEGLLQDYEIWPGRGYVDLEIYAFIHTQGISIKPSFNTDYHS